jgi:Dna[CI] antecedent, DciA
MPKKMARNKRRKSAMRTRAGPDSGRVHSVKELLSHRAPALTRITDQAADQAARASFWSGWLCRHLPTDLAARVSGVIEREDALVIFAASAAWSARLRYALQELEPQIRADFPALSAINVRVRPPA